MSWRALIVDVGPGGLLWALTLGLVALGSAAAAQPADAERQAAAMVQTVLDQLTAFRRDDFEAAYGFASESIRAQFTPEAFREMVTRGYAPIAHSIGARVLGTQLFDARRGLVEIRVEGRNGQTVDALYEMVEEGGAWRINGVLAKPAPAGERAGADPPSALSYTGTSIHSPAVTSRRPRPATTLPASEWKPRASQA